MYDFFEGGKGILTNQRKRGGGSQSLNYQNQKNKGETFLFAQRGYPFLFRKRNRGP